MVVAAVAFWLVIDRDHDGSWRAIRTPVDCDDGNAAVHPGAEDVPLNGIDEDCNGRDSAKGSNVILFVVDTLRARNVGVYGYERDTTPAMDKLGEGGAVFTNAYAPSPWTLPSLATIFTARHPADHGTVHPESRLAANIQSLASVLHDAGYSTGAFVHSAYPVLSMGFERGFDHVETRRPGNTDKIRAWMDAQKDKPFFMWIHYADPHVPYIMEKEFDGIFTTEKVNDNIPLAEYWNALQCQQRYDADVDGTMAKVRMAFYDSKVRQADTRVGEIVDEIAKLGLTDKTMFAITADHGEEFFEHRGCDHGQSLYDEVLHVPLLFTLPGFIAPGTVVNQQVRLMDVAPTIVDAVGLGSTIETFDGTSLVDFMRGNGKDLEVVGGFLQTIDGVVAFRKDGFKYMYTPSRTALRARPQNGEELYDLTADPEEKKNLAPLGHPKLEEFRKLAQEQLARDAKPAVVPQVDYSPEQIQKLRALGYTVDDEKK